MSGREGRRFSKRKEDFTCDVCGAKVAGTGYTDHCPNCLWSKHVDINPGDRASDCKGLMKPVKATHDRNWFLIEYRCETCKAKKIVTAAESDNMDAIFRILK